MTLDADPKVLLGLAKQLIETEEDLNFATASEPARKKTGRSKEKVKQAAEHSESSDGSQEEEEDDPLIRLRKSWLGNGTDDDKMSEKGDKSGRRKGGRFAMIEKKKKSSSAEKDSGNLATKALLQAAAKSSDPLQGLLALQIAQVAKKEKKKSRSRRKSRSSSSSSSRSSRSVEETSSSSSRGGSRGYAKAIKGYQNSGRRMFKRPLKHVRRFVKEVETDLGAQDRPFRLTECNRRIHFGKQQNLKRCHYLMTVVLELLLREKYEQAALQVVLCLRAMHQVALDGSWEVGWLLTHVPDPFRAKVFGGEPGSLQQVTSYLKSMSELVKSTDTLRKKGSGKGEEEASASQNKDAKGGKKGHRQKDKDKDKEKPAAEM